MGELSVWHWLIVAGVVVLLFGSRKLPDAARSIGRSLRIFKSEMRELHDDEPPSAQVRQTVIEGGAATQRDGSAGGPAAAGPAAAGPAAAGPAAAGPATAGPATAGPGEQPE